MTPRIDSIHDSLIEHLRKLYSSSLKEVVSSKFSRQGINGYTRYAIPAYIIAATSLESFVNEMFISPMGRSFFKGIVDAGYWDTVEKNEIAEKLLNLPRLYFDETFEANRQPYQDVKILIKIRNDLAHFKMQFETPKYVKPLQKRGIALDLPNSSWLESISSSEGIRWAHNTVCATIKKIGEFKNIERHVLLAHAIKHPYYNLISDSVAKKLLQE